MNSMMQQRTKNITLLFIWLTGLMFFAHSIIPHHHHFDSIFDHQPTGQTDQHQEDNPLHCHAFNDLAVDKAVISFSNVSIADDFPAVVSDNGPDFRLNDQCGTEIIPEVRDDISPEPAFFESAPSRGSPAMA